MSQVSLVVKSATVGTKAGVKRLLLTLEAPAGVDIDAVAAQITENQELDIELPTHGPVQ